MNQFEPAPLFRELIDIPERIHSGDFVLKLTDGLSHAKETVRDYVVTPQLQACFDDALSFIESATVGGVSKAAYLHGSFGAGKSHFMAVLNLLLAGDRSARAIPELAGLVVKHDGWASGRRFLMVPYHMIGERDLESAILGQYARHVRRLHPEAPVPGFYVSEDLFRNADATRSQIGDATFFARLNEGKESGGDGWGALDSGLWDAKSYESARREPLTGHERQRLIGDLIRVWYPSYTRMADTNQAYVPLDEGLSVLSDHAQALGYDAVVLFLDELILWLATHAANVDFVSREGSKLSKLVEAIHARSIPLISFIARQRDLRELVGQNLAGSLQLQFADTLKHWEARFHRITLEDRNLPVIAQKRILRPKSEAARRTIEESFDALKVRRQAMDTLLGSTGEEKIFRQVYPFSPALVQTLVAVSSALQRERTALKLMLQLLVDRRDELTLGQLIPVGDLWDVIADGDEPFSEAMKVFFEGAQKLYKTKLLPLIERQNDVTWEEVKDGRAAPEKAAQLRNDARLIKTLLLAALVPEVESLKALTSERLAALNHGSVRSVIPGREGAMVLSKLRNWAAEVGEIKAPDDMNPVISIQITGVDTDPILAAVESEDNTGNRRRLIRTTLFEILKIEDNGGLFQDYTFTWRGTRRTVNIMYENVREMSADRLRGQAGAWTVVFDFPFDDPTYGSRDDIARLHEFRRDGDSSDTIVWLPSFLSAKALRDLGTLVKLNYLLSGADRFAEHARHLSAVDRDQAKALLENQRSQLRQRLRACLEVAYGLSDTPQDAVDSPLDANQHLHSLDGFKPLLPVGGTLKGAFDALLDQLFTYLHPAHPQFDGDVKLSILRNKVLPELRKALAEPEGRLFIADKQLREQIRSIVNPLKLANMGETHLVIEHEWRTHFAQQHARHGGPMTVAKLRAWMDEPRSRGLTREVQNLIILTYADQTSRVFMRGSSPAQTSLEAIEDTLELREQTLPSEEEWREALSRAGALFALTPLQVRSAGNVAKLSGDAVLKAKAFFEPVKRMAGLLELRLEASGVDPEGADRLISARAARSLLAGMIEAKSDEIVAVLARAELRTSVPAVGRTIAQAKALGDLLEDQSRWGVFETVSQLNDARRGAGEAILRTLAETLSADEHVTALRPVFEEAFHNGLKLLQETQAAPPSPPAAPAGGVPGPSIASPPVVAPTAPEPDEIVVEAMERRGLAPAEAREILAGIERQLRDDPQRRLSLSWKIVRKGGRA